MPKIGIIGCGKVGSSLAHKLLGAGADLRILISRNAEKVISLSENLGIPWSEDLKELKKFDLECCIVAVSDDAIFTVVKEVASLLPDTFILHTSGSFETLSMRDICPRLGVLYPLQSFSEGRSVDWSRLPICIFAENRQTLEMAEQMAQLLSEKVFHIHDEDRAYIHLAAVYINNFTNALAIMAEHILDRKDLPFELLQELLIETAAKLTVLTPVKAQTGPAVRGDITTLEKHKNLLSEFPIEFTQVYEIMSDWIRTSKKEE